MSATTFIALRDALVERGLISSTRNMSANEQLGIFLYGVGHGVANRILAETFQYFGETISRHFNNVVRGIVTLKDDYIMLPSSNAAVHPRIRDNSNFHPFKNAIGAIDGTHIPVVVRRSKQAPFRCRKGFTSQNMMVGWWEGSAADMRVLRWACELGGFVVPEVSLLPHHSAVPICLGKGIRKKMKRKESPQKRKQQRREAVDSEPKMPTVLEKCNYDNTGHE
ncbi:hypothetical protein ACMD2_22726, partial [Ananas comosus]